METFRFLTDIMETLGVDSWPSLWVKIAAIWAENQRPDKDIGIWGQSLKPLWEGPYQVIFSSLTAVKVPGIDS